MDGFLFDLNKIYSENSKKIIDYKPRKFYNIFFKRFVDFSAAFILILICFPFFILIGFIIKSDSKGPVFYRGIRTGYHGKQFRIFKFRSMVENAENLGGGTTALNDPRITPAGNFLRKTKIDETPQLLNILLGNMSFIGPRPELPKYTDQYKGLEMVIFDLRPGLTDYSSLHFISLDEIVGEKNADEIFENSVLQLKNQLRVKYVLEQNVFVDIKIFFCTVFQVLKKGLSLVFKNNKQTK